MTQTQQTIECRSPECSNTFTQKNRQHAFCCASCRRATRGADWYIIRKAAIRRDGSTCQDCGDTGCALDVHHIIALYLGGTNLLCNLMTLCKPCHRLRHKSWKPARAGRTINAQIQQTTKEGSYVAA
jgi:5-methylcytosine-specific restriction endonuclease McrA